MDCVSTDDSDFSREPEIAGFVLRLMQGIDPSSELRYVFLDSLHFSRVEVAILFINNPLFTTPDPFMAFQSFSDKSLYGWNPKDELLLEDLEVRMALDERFQIPELYKADEDWIEECHEDERPVLEDDLNEILTGLANAEILESIWLDEVGKSLKSGCFAESSAGFFLNGISISTWDAKLIEFVLNYLNPSGYTPPINLLDFVNVRYCYPDAIEYILEKMNPPAGFFDGLDLSWLQGDGRAAQIKKRVRAYVHAEST